MYSLIVMRLLNPDFHKNINKQHIKSETCPVVLTSLIKKFGII